MENLTRFNLEEAIAVLGRTPATLDALLRGLPDVWVRSSEGNDTWSAFVIVGHLIVGERTDWMPRVRIILENGEARPFDPFDRSAEREIQGKSLEQLLDEFARLRRENLAALQALNLQTEDLVRRGKHPALGVVTLAELLATWVVHDLTHVHQLSRVMAHQYRDAVGPWSVYLGVLKVRRSQRSRNVLTHEGTPSSFAWRGTLQSSAQLALLSACLRLWAARPGEAALWSPEPEDPARLRAAPAERSGPNHCRPVPRYR